MNIHCSTSIRGNEAMEGTVYADYQASTPVDPAVADAMHHYNMQSFANPHSADHAAGWQASKEVETATNTISRRLGCDSESIVFTSGATEANNLAIIGAAGRAPSGRRRILVGAAEHKSVLAAAQKVSRWGVATQTIPVDSNGQVRIDELSALLNDDVLLVSIAAVQNEVGGIAPLEEIERVCHDAGALLHVDAAQALAARDLDITGLGIDLVSLSAHKVYGPKGIGALVVAPEVRDKIEPLIVGGGQQNGLRAGTVPVPLCIGFAKAVELISGATAVDERARVAALRNRFLALISVDARVELNGPALPDRHPGNCNVRMSGVSAGDLLGRLQPKLAASTGSACTSGSIEPSHVLRAMGMSDEMAQSSIRFSFGRFSTAEEIDRAAALLLEALRAKV